MQPQDIALYTGITLTVLNIFDRVSILKEKAKSPYKDHENRITHLEDKVAQFGRNLDNDGKRIKNLEDGGKVLIKSMSALLSHGIDGNNIQEMKIAREELNEYLIERK